MTATPKDPRPRIWRALRRAGEATVADLAKAAKASTAVTLGYLRALMAAGHADRHGLGRPGEPFVYRPDPRAPEAPPALREDKRSAAIGDRQDRMWRSMKMLTTFSAQDLAITASLPGKPVSRQVAQHYLRWLLKAGYLAVPVAPKGGRRGRAGLYRLVRNTGPKAPRIQGRVREIVDPNTQQVVWRQGQGSVRDAA